MPPTFYRLRQGGVLGMWCKAQRFSIIFALYRCRRVYKGWGIIFFSVLMGALAWAEVREDAMDEPYEKKEILQNKTAKNPYVLLPYKPNFAVFSYTTRPNTAPYESLGLGPNGLDHTELEFQLSLHFPLLGNRFNEVFDASFAFTTHAFWQAFNESISSPFRDTTYEPELRLTLKTPVTFGGITNVSNSLIFNHQSNGKYQVLSRSWNRIMLDAVFEKGNYVTSIRPWYRLPEKKKQKPDQSSGDDNPDIQDYLGYFEWLNVYKVNKHAFSLTFFNNCRTDTNRSTVALSYSVPVHGRLKAYVNYFNGYGRSLIDYNARQQVFSIGMALNDWL